MVQHTVREAQYILPNYIIIIVITVVVITSASTQDIVGLRSQLFWEISRNLVVGLSNALLHGPKCSQATCLPGTPGSLQEQGKHHMAC